MNGTIRILHLEDNMIDALLVQSILKQASIKFEYDLSDSEIDFQAFLQKKEFDIILSDYNLPDYTGIEALLYARSNFPNTPFVFLSGAMGEEAAIESLLNGATDYVLKNRMERLVPAILRAFKESQGQKARQLAERQLQQSEENFRRSISESPLGIRIVDVDGFTVYANKAFLEIYEFDRLEEFTTMPARERYTSESYKQHLERKEIRRSGQDTLTYELSIIRKNNEIRYIKILRNEVLWDGVKHYQVINQDITEQKKLTADLIAAKEKAEESDRLKSAFLANISHEIRTPMNGILGFAELLKEPKLSEAEAREYISIIEKSGIRMLNLMEQIINISKLESGQVTVSLFDTNVNALIEQVCHVYKPMADEKGIRLSFINSLSADECILQTDRAKVLDVLSNLVRNAIKFSDEGSVEFGYVLVETHNYASPSHGHDLVETHNCASPPHGHDLEKTHNCASLQIQFYVKDQGIGVPKDRQTAIFERFIQADIGDKRAFQGIGLGLSISKAYIEMLGGKIWVESDPENESGEKGSIFYFTLPFNHGKV
jgi:PAS domain S-box-containing protein